MKLFVLSIAVLITTGVEGGSLFKETFAESRQDLPCCQDDNLLSCHQVDLDAASLGDEDLDLTPLNITVQFKGLVEGSEHSYHYENDLVDIVLTDHNGDIYGHMSLDNGDSYVVEYCGQGIHVIKQLDVANLGENSGVDSVEFEDGTKLMRSLTPAERQDTTTIVTFTVKVYYTPEFAAVTSDIDGFIEQVMQETNQGYINSKVPLRVKALGSELATLNDIRSPSKMLSAFRTMKGTAEALRGSADAAALLVKSFSACGIAYMNTIGSGTTVSVTAKSCALGYYSFGHELGHNIGLTHNKEVAKNSKYAYGHAHLIANCPHSSGFRTILAYYADGHRTRVNYYSNPDVIYPGTGTPTGVEGVSNNARILTQNRFALAEVGKDTKNAADCVLSDVSYESKRSYKGSTTQAGCKEYCTKDSRCFLWLYQHWTTYCSIFYIQTGSGKDSIPDLSKPECHLGNECLKEKAYFTGFKTLEELTTNSAAECHTKCASSKDCAFWKKSDSRCYLYARKYWPGWHANERFNLGTKYC
jgi:hypothetical protein